MGKIIGIIAAAALVLYAGYWFMARGTPQPQNEPATSAPAATTTAAANATNNKIMNALLHTSKGDIAVSFFTESAPNTVANFIKLARDGFYDGTKFHRIIKGFMIQGGDPLSKDDSQIARWGTGGPGYAFNDELTGAEKYPQGTVAMANSGPNTNGSQFFIVTASPGAQLPPSYTVFGKVTAGMDIALAIENVPTYMPGRVDRPLEPVILTSVEVK